ncbi:hypothetical protein MCEMRE182_01417 [Candidatus Nanopelagicaceae bacterium]
MAKVSIKDSTVDRFSVWHHRYDDETHHFRWFLVECFDNKKEMDALLREKWDDQDFRSLNGGSHPKEQFVGRIEKSPLRKFRLLRS